ncbi:MAG: RNA polymerase sigma factor [Chloroflexi bacterium]|nr:RNA polymerase sigma factor [Chloroflexota bacterium]
MNARAGALFSSALRPEGGAGGASVVEAGVLSDAQLVALAHEAPADALEAIYAAYRGRIYGFLLRLVADPDVADDVTQETFTKAFGAMRTLTREHRVLPWLYRIANNAAIDHLRRRRRFSWVRLGAVHGTAEEPHEGDDHGRVADRESLRRALGGLPPENASALLLHALEGYSYQEIAAIQGVSMTAVRSRIARARTAFKAKYEQPPAADPPEPNSERQTD